MWRAGEDVLIVSSRREHYVQYVLKSVNVQRVCWHTFVSVNPVKKD